MTDSTVSERDAIDAALNQNWKEAVKINTSLLKSDKENVNTLNRLGFAYLKSGMMTAAKKTFVKVISIDQYNQIAAKNIQKLGLVKQKDILQQTNKHLSPMLFLEEPGKTKIVECINTASAATLSSVSPGQEVELRARKHTIEVRNGNNVYLGALPDDLSFRMIKYLAGGNSYLALIQSIGKNSLVIFLRELNRGKRFKSQPSFASTGLYVPSGKSETGSESTDPSDDAGDQDDSED